MTEVTTPSARGSDGFTLIEILVSLMILSFVALGIAGLFSYSIKTNASGHDYTLLATEARIALETLQALPFLDGRLTTAGSPHTTAPVNPNFTITYTVDDYRINSWQDVTAGVWAPENDPVLANLKRISMTVASTNQFLDGRRVFTVSSLKIQ